MARTRVRSAVAWQGPAFDRPSQRAFADGVIVSKCADDGCSEQIDNGRVDQGEADGEREGAEGEAAGGTNAAGAEVVAHAVCERDGEAERDLPAGSRGRAEER